MFGSKSKNNLSVGQRGEKAAVNYLKRCNYQVIETNFANKTGRRLGEIDIIAMDDGEIVFIEVKTREKNLHMVNLPEENITATKLYKLNKIASFTCPLKNYTPIATVLTLSLSFVTHKNV